MLLAMPHLLSLVTMLEIAAVSKDNCIRAAADGDAEALQRFFRQPTTTTPSTSTKDNDAGRSPESYHDSPVHQASQLSELCATLFREAIENGQLTAVETLLEIPAITELHQQEPSRMSELLTQAIVEDYSEIVACLLKHGADPNRPLSYGEDTSGGVDDDIPQLSLATRLGSLEIAQLLVSKGANVAARHEVDGATVLHEAARYDEDELILFLVQSGANVNALDEINGETPLHVAVKKGNRKAVAALIKCHANLNIANKRGSSAVHIATVESQSGILELLLAAGASNIEGSGSLSVKRTTRP